MKLTSLRSKINDFKRFYTNARIVKISRNKSLHTISVYMRSIMLTAEFIYSYKDNIAFPPTIIYDHMLSTFFEIVEKEKVAIASNHSN